MSELPTEATCLLDGLAEWDGHNGFLNSEGKEKAIQYLRIIARLPNRPDPEAIELYLALRQDVSKLHDGAGRARRWYEEILRGKSHRIGSSQRAIVDPPLSWDPERQTWHLPGR